MIKLYLNYSNSTATIHQTSDCPRIQMHHSPDQRQLKINLDTFRTVMQDFIEGNFVFKSEHGLNDAWLEMDFNDLEFEIAVVKYVIFLLGKQYEPFDRITPDIHC